MHYIDDVASSISILRVHFLLEPGELIFMIVPEGESTVECVCNATMVQWYSLQDDRKRQVALRLEGYLTYRESQLLIA